MSFLQTACIALALGFSSAFLWAADTLGAVTYLEGDVSMVRGGKTLDSSLAQIGLALENYDLVATGTDGVTEINVSSPKAPGMTIKVSPRTRFSFEIGKLGSKNQTTVGMIVGSISLKAARLSGGQDVQVRTGSVAAGVRGTSFMVTTTPGGDTLITADEGEVTCTDDAGKELRAVPGTVVEKRPGELFRSIPIAVSSLEKFRNDWYVERIDSLKANASRAIRDYAQRYDKLYLELTTNYQSLTGKEQILRKWIAEDQQGTMGGTLEVMSEKKQIVGDLFKLRGTLFIMERIYYRLVELKEYHDQGFGRGTLSAGVSTTQFFQRLDREGRTLEGMMATIRYVTRLYAMRNDDQAPTSALDAEIKGTEDFFGNSDFPETPSSSP